MKKEINFGIGFVTGRSNVCNIINSYYNDILKQMKQLDCDTNVTIYILYDLTYQNAKREDFYKIDDSVYESGIKIEYITPEKIEEIKNNVVKNNIISVEESETFFGYGHARGRNTVMYSALKQNIDYLLFWDDDEYPYAVEKMEDGQLVWKKQDNILQHLKYIEDASVTIGYHCGYISPIPYIDYKNEINEDILKNYIEAISNDILNWDNLKEKFEKHNGVTFAEADISDGKIVYEKKNEDGVKWVAGSTLCLNLNDIENIPAFFNPPAARGEDTFFSTQLSNAKVIKVPVYHFHDGFLKYKGIMNGTLPKYLRKIEKNEGESVEERFLAASRGWIKYKPLFSYIMDREHYKENMEHVEKSLNYSVSKVNEMFKHTDFSVVLDDFNTYHNRVEEDYNNYLLTNEIWNKLKKNK